MSKTVYVGCYVQTLPPFGAADAIVAIDVIRATTTAATAVARGRRCFPAGDIEEAVAIAARLEDPLLVGELGGNMPYGFELNNSPAELARRDDVWRPMVLLSTSGTRLLRDAAARGASVYAACLRNYTAQIEHLALGHESVALLGAASRGEFREEDQLCCAWIAAALIERGFRPLAGTAEIVERWRGETIDVVASGNSADYLRRTDQTHDLEFVMQHVDDLDAVFELVEDELIRRPITTEARSTLAAS